MAPRWTSAAIVRGAKSYIGAWRYVFGGVPDPPRHLTGDCSSYITTVLGYNARLAVPGGRWGDPDMPPHAHGPVVVDYANWSGARTVGLPQAGDLCIWVGLEENGHIGLAISPTEMVSALNPLDGVMVTPIQGTGPSGSPLIYRRLLGIPAIGGLAVPAAGGQSIPAVALLIPVLLIGGAFVAAGILASMSGVLAVKGVRGATQRG